MKHEFISRYPEAFSPENLAASGIPPSGIALVMEWSEETTQARLDLITDLTNESRPWRVASMPGVDLEGLGLSVSDFKVINEYSYIAFAMIARAVSATLSTINPDGSTDKLLIPLRKSYCPIISTGEIGASSWGNFPSGETFVVPDEFTASGSVTVRGSIPLHPFSPAEWVRFELERGRILFSSVEASSIDLKKRFLSLIFKRRGAVKCSNANALAELGIGTNPGIVHLTGKPIFDEKKLGTVHIAFGKNTQFTGPLKSCVHHDIVCTSPTLTFHTNLRDVELIRDGEIVADLATAVPTLADLPADNLNQDRVVRLGDVAHQFTLGAGDEIPPRFQIDYASNRQQNIRLALADGETAAIANAVLNVVGKRRKTTVAQIPSLLRSQFGADACTRVIAGLLEYGLLK
jgi:hypothetical protein